MKSKEMQKFYEILENNNKTVLQFCKEIELPYTSFQVMTVSTKNTPRWIKAFLYASEIKAK